MLCLAGTASAAIPLPVQKPVPEILLSGATADDAHDVLLPARKPGFARRTAPIIIPAAKPAAVKDKPPLTAWLFSRFTESRRLSEDDAARYGHIFAFQDVGAFDKADAEIAKLDDKRLMGHVLRQRYMGADYASSYEELAAWLDQYADHPGAEDIYGLAISRKPAAAAAPAQPVRARGGTVGHQDFDVGRLGRPYLDSIRMNGSQKQAVREIEDMLGKDRPSAALQRLETAKGLFSKTGYDALQAQVAQSYFFNAQYKKAYGLATSSADRSGSDVPIAGWVAGLAAWKSGSYADSARYFAQSAQSPRASAWMSSASAYWAARAHLRAHNPREVSRWLARAAKNPRTFYGLIALKALGVEHEGYNWDVPKLTDKRARALSRIPAGRRALALADAGRPDLAGLELRAVSVGDNETLQEAMVALTADAGIPDLALRMGSAYTDPDGDHYDAALYPDAPWRPVDGFDVDRALVYAFIRQESRFDARATNRSTGAAGVMQLMPATARHVARQMEDGEGALDLHDPVVNVALGQKYLSHLLQNPAVDGNLFKLAVAYNAGPGKLARWEKQVAYADDPLLFIESIPVSETRMFVERVMTNFWIYRIKYGQDTQTLDSVAGGEWPVYTAQDIRRGLSFADAATFFMR